MSAPIDSRLPDHHVRLGYARTAPDTTYRELFRSGIFTLLEEGERFSVSGAAGRIWGPVR